MTIHVHKYSDASAPALSGLTNGTALQTLLMAVLVNGYGSHTGHGWTVVHDTTRLTTATTTDGRLILERPDADFVFVMDNSTAIYYIVGLADAGFSDGSVTHYQSGKRQAGSSTDLQRVTDSSSARYFQWLAIYDDVSHTLIITSSQTSAQNYGHNNAAGQNTFFYLGTLAVPSSIGFDVPILMAGSIRASHSSNDNNGINDGNATTLVRHDGSPSTDGTYIYKGSGFYASSLEYDHIEDGSYPAEPYIPLVSIGVGVSSAITGGNNDNMIDVGVLRGVYRHASMKGSTYVSDWMKVNFPTQWAIDNRISTPVSVDGKTMYVGGHPFLFFMSTHADDWVL